MIDTVGNAGADDADLVCYAGVVGKPVRNPKTALAVLLPFALRGEKGGVDLAHSCDGAFEAVWQTLAGQLLQKWLGIEQVKVTGAAFHEEKDDVFGLPEAVRNLAGCGRTRRGRSGEDTLARKGRQGRCTKAQT